jgi:hypothetical protein
MTVFKPLLIGLTLLCGSLQAQAQGFSALISPPRIETTVKPGQTTRQVVEITQVGPVVGRFRVYTNDWSISPAGGAVFTEELKPDSCRQWVALKRPQGA